MKSVTICIPTLNGMSSLPSVIEALRIQTFQNFEILVVDSSSSDGTYEYCLSVPNCSVFLIKQVDFSHSKTRQWMAEWSNSDIVVFLTQDAVPHNPNWLEQLVLGHLSSAVACCFSRHTAKNPLAKRRLDEHFDWLDRTISYPASIRKDLYRWQNDQSYRRAIHFNSDNSSAYQRQLLVEFPFPDVPYGEDQVWAEMMLRNGFEVNFANTSVVDHWNQISFSQAKDRGELEAKTWMLNMGYEYQAISLKKSIVIALRRFFSDLKLILKGSAQFSRPTLLFTSTKMNLELVGFWAGARGIDVNRK